MTKQPESLRLADELEMWTLGEPAAGELRRLYAQIAACEPYLKEGETPAERIQRDHRDSLALMTLLAREKTKNEALLEALREIVAAADGTGWDQLDPSFKKARAAIAKAEAA